MDNRLQLQKELEKIVGKNVYFQPPASVLLNYPCVIYGLSGVDIKRADDTIYRYTNKFDLLFIYKQSNIEIIGTVLRAFPMCSVSRIYVADNLYHYAFSLYY